MPKPVVIEHRYDFRGGRNTSISPDLLNPNELVDCTNARLTSTYGGFAKRSGSQRIHPDQLPAAVMGVTQWDSPSGKQVVAIANGDLYYRNGFAFGAPFTKVSTAGFARTTANQGVTAGWVDPDGVDNGINQLTAGINTDTFVANGSKLRNHLGDPSVDNNVVAADSLYTLSFKVTCDASAMSGAYSSSTASVQIEYSLNSTTGADGTWFALPGGPYVVTVATGFFNTVLYTPTVSIPVTTSPVWVRLALEHRVEGFAAGTSTSKVQIFNTIYKTNNYPITWTTGFPKFSTTQPAFFAPFRASTAGAPLVLYIASGGHYFSWDGAGTIVPLDGSNNAPLTTNIISYHTRMFAMSASTLTPGLLPKTIFWSVLGDATDFRTGTKIQGGSAVTDFLTGQQLVGLEVIGSSMLMATNDSVMRFTGHASDDIVIAEDTEGITAEIGTIGPQTLKRFENVAAMLSDRGPYLITETSAEPMGEQLNPDWQALDIVNLNKSSIEYNRNRKELLFAVPRATDGGVPKTIFSHSVRLQAWQGPWIYPFGINCQGKYFDSLGVPLTLAGGTDGYIRLMDVGNLDDILSDGTGGSNITMTVEFPVLHFGVPGLKKALKWLLLQASFPIGSTPNIAIGFDGASTINFPITASDTGEEDYRLDIAGDASQGFRCQMIFSDSSAFNVIVNGFTLIGWNYQRTT